MPKGGLLRRLSLLLMLFAAAPAQSQNLPPQPPPVEGKSEPAQPEQPEPPMRILNIDVTDGRLSVELVNVDFGSAIREVGGKAGFVVQGAGEVFSRKLDTKFSNIEIERGVTRLLSLVNEKNYMLYYSPEGAITKLDIYSSVGSPSPSPLQPSRPPFPSRPRPIARPMRPQDPSGVVAPSIPPRPIPPPARPTAPPPRPVDPQASTEEQFSEDNAEAVPYVPPQPKQPFFAPRRN